MKTLAIINEKGGVGKSFIATQFALYAVSNSAIEYLLLT